MTAPPLSRPTTRPPRRFTVKDYQRMGEHRILHAGVELLDGVVWWQEGLCPPEPYRFTWEDVLTMVRAGILHEDERVELIDGQVVEMSPIGDRHVGAVNWLNMHFAPRLVNRAIVQVQCPVRLRSHYAPQPDLMLPRWRDDFYRGTGAGPTDVLLVIEVADTSLAADREKLAEYAAAAIPETWVFDLPGAAAEVSRDPRPGQRAYASHQRLTGEAALSPLAFPDVSITVADVLGR